MALPHATPIVPLLLALTLALGGCDSSLHSQLLTEEIPPCTPAPGSSVDPCEPDVERPWPWGVEGIGSPLALVVEHVSQRDMLDVGDAWVLAPHIVLRGTYLPNTTRCTAGNPFRPSPYVASELGYDEYDYPDSFSINCYTDLSVSAYVLGEGPSALTVQTLFYPYVEGTGEHLRQEVETDEYAGWVAGREAVLFIGPPVNLSSEAWQVFGIWDVQRREDGVVLAVHPERDLWRRYRPDDYRTLRSALEMELPAFAEAVTTASQARLAANGGRIGAHPDLPMLITDAHKLRQFMTDIGAYDHPDGPPAPPPPVR